MNKPGGGIITFHASKILNGWAKHCKGQMCGGGKITVNQKYWLSGRDRDKGKHGYVLCQKCFGFWLARYTQFDYDPFGIDITDLRWEKYWKDQAENYAAELWVENMIKNVSIA